MNGHTLESVSESYVKDMLFFLDRIDSLTRVIEAEGAANSIECDCHSICCIAAMVGAESLARCARMCEWIVGTLSKPAVTDRPRPDSNAIVLMLNKASALMRRMTRLTFSDNPTHAALEQEMRAIMQPWQDILQQLDSDDGFEEFRRL